MMSQEIWRNEEVFVKLKQLTRKCKFDFKMVSNELKVFIRLNFPPQDEELTSKLFSPDECRRAYAGEYSLPPISNDHSTADSSINNNIQKTDTIMISSDSIHNMKILNDTESRKTIALKNAFESLRNENCDTSENRIDPAISHYNRVVADRSLQKQREDNIEMRNKEKQILISERERLRKRFDIDSVDCQGVDPSKAVETISDNESHVDKLIIPEDLNSLDIFALLQSQEFDKILDEVERDLESEMKSNTRTEMSEILDILDASISNKKYQSKRN